MIGTALSLALRAAIRAYQLLLSPLVGPRCRFAPSCSEYAAEAITHHGPWAGLLLALKRLARCHPWGGTGYDPVPVHPCANRAPYGEHRLRSPRRLPTSTAPAAPSASPSPQLRA